jgi:TP901 family phage tail tape measure protein
MPITGEPIAKAEVAIIADDSAYNSSLNNAEKRLGVFDKKTSEMAKKAGMAFVAAGTVITGALAGAVLGAAKYGDSLDKLSLRTGVAVEDLSKLGYAVGISGSDMNALETSLRFLARRMDETNNGIGIAKEQFEKLNISVVDTGGNMRPLVDVMLDVSEGITGLKSESEKTALAMDVFGARSGPQLLPLLKEGKGGIEELMRAAEALGLVVSTEAATASAEFTDRLLEVKETAKKAAFELGQALLPAVTDLMEHVRDTVGFFNNLTKTQQKIVAWGAAVAGGLSLVAGGALLLVGHLPAIIAGFTAIIAFPATIPIVIGVAALAAAAGLVVYEVRHMNKELEIMTGQMLNKEAVEGYSGAMEQLLETIKGAETNFMEAAVSIGQTSTEAATGTERLAVVTKALGDDILVTDEAFQKIIKIMGDADGYISVTDAAKKVTEGLNEIVGDTAKVVEDAEKVWKRITEAFNDYVFEQGQGWGISTLQAEQYFKKILEEGNKQPEIERKLKEEIVKLRQEQLNKLGFLEAVHTAAQAKEIKKRETFVGMAASKEHSIREKNLDLVVAARSDALEEESGMIKKFFDWGFIVNKEAAAKLLALEKQKTADMIAESERYFDAMIRGTERIIQVREKTNIKDYDLLVRGNQAKLAAARKLSTEQGQIVDFMLRNASRMFEKQVDLQVDMGEMSKREVKKLHEDSIDAVDQTFELFKGKMKDLNIDLIDLEEWRAKRIMEIDKKLHTDRIGELDDYYQTYEDRVKEAEAFWGPSGIPLSSGVYGGNDPEYLRKLNFGLADVVFFGNQAEKSLLGASKVEEDMAKSTAKLVDELAGHSLTTALDEVVSSMSGMDDGLSRVISGMEGIDDITQIAVSDISDFNDKLGNNLTLAKEYYTKLATIRSRIAGGYLYTERAQQEQFEAARKFAQEYAIWTQEEKELFPERAAAAERYWMNLEKIKIEAAGGWMPFVDEEPQAPLAKREGIELHLHVENVYGTDEEHLNDLAEDIWRRIQGQNLHV